MKKLVILATVALGACTTTFMFGRIGPDSAPPSYEESIIVLGIWPENIAVNIFPGKVEDGVFKVGALSGAAISGPPKEGYVVAKVAADQVLALMKSTQLARAGEVLSPTFGACDGLKAISFVVPHGKVIYLADIEYQPMDGKKVSMHYTRDLEKARRYVDKNYPQLADRLEQGNYDFVRTNASCTTTIDLHLYRKPR